MAKFAEMGYAICCAKVCPSRAGVPMTRQRIHYQALCGRRYPDAPALMQQLENLWNQILNVECSAVPLDQFLEVDGEQNEYLRAKKELWSQREPKEKSGKEQWKKLHEKVFASYEEGRDKDKWYHGIRISVSLV